MIFMTTMNKTIPNKVVSKFLKFSLLEWAIALIIHTVTTSHNPQTVNRARSDEYIDM